jgi:hypothetical protein
MSKFFFCKTDIFFTSLAYFRNLFDYLFNCCSLLRHKICSRNFFRSLYDFNFLIVKHIAAIFELFVSFSLINLFLHFFELRFCNFGVLFCQTLKIFYHFLFKLIFLSFFAAFNLVSLISFHSHTLVHHIFILLINFFLSALCIFLLPGVIPV